MTMKSKTNSRKPAAQENTEAKPGCAPATGSASLPTKVLRLVLQLEDTTTNRVLMDAAYAAVKRAASPIQGGHAVLKREEVYIADFELPRSRFASSPVLPSPDAKATQTATADAGNQCPPNNQAQRRRE